MPTLTEISITIFAKLARTNAHYALSLDLLTRGRDAVELLDHLVGLREDQGRDRDAEFRRRL